MTEKKPNYRSPGLRNRGYSLRLFVPTLFCLLAISVFCGACDNVTDPDPVQKTIAKPVATPSAGAVKYCQTVELSCATAGAEIWYTVDDTVPTQENGIIYSTAIIIDQPMTVKAVAVKDGMEDSEILEAAYTIAPFVVTFDNNDGTTPAISVNVEYTEGTAVLPNTPSRDGCIFNGWNTKADGSGDEFTDSTVVIADITVYAQWKIIYPITSPSVILSYLTGETGGTAENDPVELKVEFELSGTNYTTMFTAINSADKYVSLDLSKCTGSDADINSGGLNTNGQFTPGSPITTPGVTRIVDFVIPDAATALYSSGGAVYFTQFTNLKTFKAANSTLGGAGTVSISGFAGLTKLTTVDAPKATGFLADGAFSGCTALSYMNLSSLASFVDSFFSNTGDTALTIILGATPPATGATMFNGVASKNVTIKVPASAVNSYDDATWKTGFTGGNANINVTVEALP